MTTVLATAAASAEYELLATAMEKYGLMGVLVIGVIVVAVMYQKNESKKIDLEIQKNMETQIIKEETEKVTGLVEQMQREIDGSMIEVKGMLSKQEIETLKREHSEEEVRSTLTEIKTQLRELSRDVNRSN